MAWPARDPHRPRQGLLAGRRGRPGRPGLREDEPEKTILVGFGRTPSSAQPTRSSSSQGRQDPPLLPHRRAATGQERPQLLHRLRQGRPEDCVILTLACGKYRFNKLDFRRIGAFPAFSTWGSAPTPFRPSRSPGPGRRLRRPTSRPAPFAHPLLVRAEAVCILLSLLYLGVKDIASVPVCPPSSRPRLRGPSGEVQPSAHRSVEDDLRAFWADGGPTRGAPNRKGVETAMETASGKGTPQRLCPRSRRHRATISPMPS